MQGVSKLVIVSLSAAQKRMLGSDISTLHLLLFEHHSTPQSKA
jgi:hypothetical protein